MKIYYSKRAGGEPCTTNNEDHSPFNITGDYKNSSPVKNNFTTSENNYNLNCENYNSKKQDLFEQTLSIPQEINKAQKTMI